MKVLNADSHGIQKHLLWIQIVSLELHLKYLQRLSSALLRGDQ